MSRSIRKDCDCAGTSSGPRAVLVENHTPASRGWLVIMANMACDACDRPWVERDPRYVCRLINPGTAP